MSETIINGIDTSECPCKDDDKCLEVPILNEYGDLIDYQDCEPQTLCPYRSKTKIQRLQEENEELEEKIKSEKYIKENALQEATKYSMKCGEFRQALEEIKEKLKEIKEIAQGMHDWWINKTSYTDVYELAEHLLGTELNRILGVLEDNQHDTTNNKQTDN